MKAIEKLFFWTAPLAVLLSVSFFHYGRYFEHRAYSVLLDVDCDPAASTCYTWPCEEGNDCEAIYYTKLLVPATHVPLCAEQLQCTDVTCANFPEGTCEEYVCTEEYLIDGEECTAASTQSHA